MKSKLLFGLFFSLILLNGVLASIKINSYEVDQVYSPGEYLRGWMNLNFSNVKNGLLTCLDQNISLKEFLDRNKANYTCDPTNCLADYDAKTKKSSHSFSLDSEEEQLIGIKLDGEITSIDSFKMNISSDGGPSCIYPLEIDFFDDGVIDWRYINGTGEYTCSGAKSFGCFESSDVEDDEDLAVISSEDYYCEKINISHSGVYKIGGVLYKIESGENIEADFEMSIDDGKDGESCEFSVSESGEAGCEVELNIDKEITTEVCITAREDDDSELYGLRYEDEDPCGTKTDSTKQYDFEIFAKASKYSAPGNLTLDKDTLDMAVESEIMEYLTKNYKKNCTDGCIIPINIISGTKQNITVDNFKMSYVSNGKRTAPTTFYLLDSSEAKIDMKSQKLDISKAEIDVTDYDDEKAILEINGERIFSKKISVEENAGEILAIAPSQVPSIISNIFFVVTNSDQNFTYVWNFGDGQTITTNDKMVRHSYTNTGTYTIKVTATRGTMSYTKSQEITVVSPKEAIPSTIELYDSQLKNVNLKLSLLPSWIKTEIDNRFNISQSGTTLNLIKTAYNSKTNTDYEAMAGGLVSLSIPTSFLSQQIMTDSLIFLEDDVLNVNDISKLGLGFSVNKDYSKWINSWILENLDITATVQKYDIGFNSGIQDAGSYVTIKLTPKHTTGEFYVMINRGSKNTVFVKDYGQKAYDSSDGIGITSLSESRTFEFYYPDAIDSTDFPFYIIPKENLAIEEVNEDEVTCGNEICDEGETYWNCIEDCKPVKKMVFFYVLLVFAFFATYIVLQELYKKFYEGHLFPNKNDLFNLINFMNNTENQGVLKVEIFSKLREMDWNSEQLDFAWKRLHGKRTGMFEIPIFRFWENRKVGKEIEKRQGMPMQVPRFKR